MGWLSYLAATDAQNGVRTLQERIKELEGRVQTLEWELRSLRLK